MANNWHQYCKWILRMHRLSHSAWIQVPPDSIKFQFLYLSRCSAVITMILLLWLLLISWGQGGTESSWDEFSETLVRRIHRRPLRGCVSASIRQRFRTVHATGYRSAQERAWVWLALCSVIKMRWKLQMVGFSYDKKSANVVMWKDEEYEYISSKWN